MEHLSKQQIILLALLVSLFTSIVTGVVVVSFSEQVRTGEVKPITDTVVRTIERVIQPATSTKVVTPTTQNIVVTYEDKAAENLEKVKPYVWYLESNIQKGQTMSVAIPISTDGLFLTIKPLQGVESTMTIKDAYGNTYPAVQQSSRWLDLAVFKIATTSKIKVIPKNLIATDPRIGQSIMSYGGTVSNQTAGFGNIARIPKIGGNEIPYGQSNITQQLYGSLLVAVDGKIIGLQTPDQSGRYIPLSFLVTSQATTTAI